MRTRVNRAGKEVRVRWTDEAFECALSVGPEVVTDDEQSISRPFGTYSSFGRNPALKRRAICSRPFGTLARRIRRSRAFTIVELLVVITIIGLLAAVALPHLGGFGKSNSMTAATRQMMDDVGYARQQALLNRTTVYMVFLPPTFWSWGTNATAFNKSMSAPNMTNLVAGQYSMYSMLTLSSVGDQPGRQYPKYLIPWRRLPEGVTIAREKFYQPMWVTDTNVPRQFLVHPFATNTAAFGFPFPSIEDSARTSTTFQLPYIAFLPNGSLAPTSVLTNQDDYIPLTRASVFYPRDANGVWQLVPPDWQETPPGTSTNDYHLIHINWLTGRAKLERKEIQ